MKGCICLDLDGTVAENPFSIPQEVITCLRKLYDKGWFILFSTGRPFHFAMKILSPISFPFYLSVQNGADLLSMPEKKLLAKHHIPSSLIPLIEEKHKEFAEDFLIYSGFELGDFCYYRPDKFSPSMKMHLEKVKNIVPASWQSMERFSFPDHMSFPLIKSFGTKKEMLRLCEKWNDVQDVASSLALDPLSDEEIYLHLLTAVKANKGTALKDLRKILPQGAVFIAAGDDYNDVPMWKEADICLVMEKAPKELIASYADYVVKPIQKKGMIEALCKATGEIL